VMRNLYNLRLFISFQNPRGAGLDMPSKDEAHSDLHHALVVRVNGAAIGANSCLLGGGEPRQLPLAFRYVPTASGTHSVIWRNAG
jgi:hypothetical protein